MKKLLAAVIFLTWAIGHIPAQSPIHVPVIVVLDDHARFQDFVRFYSSGPEAAANPEAWTYLDHGVVGAVRYLEQRGGFKTDRIYSHAVRGFAARLRPNRSNSSRKIS